MPKDNPELKIAILDVMKCVLGHEDDLRAMPDDTEAKRKLRELQDLLDVILQGGDAKAWFQQHRPDLLK